MCATTSGGECTWCMAMPNCTFGWHAAHVLVATSGFQPQWWPSKQAKNRAGVGILPLHAGSGGPPGFCAPAGWTILPRPSLFLSSTFLAFSVLCSHALHPPFFDSCPHDLLNYPRECKVQCKLSQMCTPAVQHTAQRQHSPAKSAAQSEDTEVDCAEHARPSRALHDLVHFEQRGRRSP